MQLELKKRLYLRLFSLSARKSADIWVLSQRLSLKEASCNNLGGLFRYVTSLQNLG